MVLLHFRDLVIILCTLHTGLEIYPQGLQEEVVIVVATVYEVEHLLLQMSSRLFLT
jgi:hypothetical protein